LPCDSDQFYLVPKAFRRAAKPLRLKRQPAAFKRGKNWLARKAKPTAARTKKAAPPPPGLAVGTEWLAMAAMSLAGKA
jgi:hypothetical protein